MRPTIIALDSVKIYQGESLVLSDLTLTVDKGEFVYLIGRTGSGKSSFLKLLYAELPVSEGTCRVANFSLNKIKAKEIPLLRRSLGIVFQDFQLLYDRDVRENLLFVLRATGWKNTKRIQERIGEVLEAVGLSTKGFKMPHELSGGEQQRVVIARALLNKPSIILADEPTGNLDPDTSKEIMNLLVSIHKKYDTAILMATHDYTLIKQFPSRVIRCANETIKEHSVEALRVV